MNLFPRLAACFRDERSPEKVRHGLADMSAQRVLGLALGYEDLNDHDYLRHDPVLALLRQDGKRGTGAPPAGSDTLGRMEQSGETGNRRYHKITPSLKKLQALLPDLFAESHEAHRSASFWISTPPISSPMGIKRAVFSTAIVRRDGAGGVYDLTHTLMLADF